jgi:amidase
MTMKTIHAFYDDALGEGDAVDVAERLRRGEVSAQEVTEAAIARAERIDPMIRGVVVSCYDRARIEAERESVEYFAGVPTFVKDNSDIAGLATNHGSAAFSAVSAKEDEPFVAQYLAQGYTVLGKSALPEFGLNATTEYVQRDPCRNPWNLDFSTGGSSGGAAALVASGVVPIAHANDGGGSIRIPAACCGLVGLKASRRRHCEKPALKYLPVNLINEGVVTRSVRDTARFCAEAETYFHNSALPEIGLVEGPGARRLRIGMWMDTIVDGSVDLQTRGAVEDTARLLESLGHTVEPIPAPLNASFAEDFGLYWSLLAFIFEKTGRRLLDPNFDASQLDQLTLGLSNQFKRKFYKAPQFIWRLRHTHHSYARVFDKLDVVLSPVLGHTTASLGHISPEVEFDELFARLMRYAGFTPWANASGGPAISLPVGVNSNNLPLSVQLFANHGAERTLLELAYEIEAARPFPIIQNLGKLI